MKKMIIHSIRYLLIAQQIKNYNSFDFEADFSIANSYFYQIMAMSSTEWDDYEKDFGSIKNHLLSEVFPKDIPSFTFIDPGLPLPIACLKRAQSSKAYKDQEFSLILDIIRLRLLTPDNFLEQFPEHFSTFEELWNKFNALSTNIQTRYNEIKSTCSDWNSEDEYRRAINEMGGKYLHILFLMKGNNCEDAGIVLQSDKAKKFLKKMILGQLKI